MNTEKKYVVVDTDVLIKASYEITPENWEEVWNSMQLLSIIMTICHCVVIDHEGLILTEYNRHIGKNDFMKRWFVSISQVPKKLVYMPRHRLNIDKLIDSDDVKFFEVAVNSPHRIFITTEEKLHRARELEEIKKFGITIWSVEEALKQL